MAFDRRGIPKILPIIISNSTATNNNIKISGTLKSTGKISGSGEWGYNCAGGAASDYEYACDRFNPNNANITQSSTSAKKSE